MVSGGEPLVELLQALKSAGYRFVTVTPATHARVLARPPGETPGLRDIFGWNRTFDPADLDPGLLALLRSAGALESVDGKLRSRVRVASLSDDLILHGAFPTDSADAVFFGPDSYRFARFIREWLPRLGTKGWLVDMGSGAGAGAMAAARCTALNRITLVDVNSAALRLARINASAAGLNVETMESARIPDGADLIIANPPYMMDSAARAYRDGGGLLGGAVAIDWVRQAIGALAPGGAMLLYTGAAYAGGKAPLLDALASACAEAGTSLELEEIDPDVFGDELGRPPYAEVERIAAVGAVITL